MNRVRFVAASNGDDASKPEPRMISISQAGMALPSLKEKSIVRNLIVTKLPPESAGWLTSVVVHAAGGLAVWMLAAGVPLVTNPNLNSRTSRIELLATWQQPEEVLDQDEPTLDAPVLIMPREARIADQTFVQSDTKMPEPPLIELATMKQLVVLPSSTNPDSDASQPDAEQESSPPTPKAATVAPRVPPSQPEDPVVGTDASTLPILLENIPPTYPAQALIQRWKGTVMLRLHLAADGRVTQVELVSSSGHRILDVEAIRAVRKWQFAPGRWHGKPVATTIRLPIQFTLDDN